MRKSRFFILIYLLLCSVTLSACNNQNSNEIKQLKEKISQLSNENEKLLSQINNYEKNSVTLKSNQIVADKVPASEFYIDITNLGFTDCDDYFLQHDNKTYVSFDFLEWFYDRKGLDSEYESNYIKGDPHETRIIKTDGGIYYLDKLSDLFKSTKDIKIVQKEYERSYILDGLKVDYATDDPNFDYITTAAYTITKPTFMTERLITVGSTRSDVKKAYGTLGKDSEDLWRAFHTNDGSTFNFTFKDNKVVEIFYRIK